MKDCKILCSIKPFILKQEIYVLNNGNKIDGEKVKMENLSSKIIDYCNEYKTDEVCFVGFRNYAKKIGDKILKESISKYNKNINIEYR